MRYVMKCARCGLESSDATLACQGCGQPFSAPRLGAAKAALVLGVLSYPLLFVCGVGAVTALLAILFGIVALVRAHRQPSVLGGRAAAVCGIALGCALVVLVTVVTMPQLVATRMRTNEFAAIRDIRDVLDAEIRYSSANGDLYDSLECLAAPARCIPGYDPAKPGFLPAELASARRRMGYLRTFRPGPVPKGPHAPGTSPSSTAGYAYLAVPVSPGYSGERSFCGDVSGRVCAMRDGSTPPLTAEGLCGDPCRTLE